MSISNAVKSVLVMNGRKQNELLGILNIGSKQALSNKMANGRWSGDDLVRIAEFTGGNLAFVYPDGQTVFISQKEIVPDAVTSGTEE